MHFQFAVKGAKLAVLVLALLSSNLAGPFVAADSKQAKAKKAIAPEVDAARAYEHVKKMVALGPHPSGSEVIKKAQQYIIGELKSYGLKIIEDNFTATTPRGT